MDDPARRAARLAPTDFPKIGKLENRRARVRSKGGDTDWLHFQSGSARLLPRLLGDRARGPLLLTTAVLSRPVCPAAVDRCPDSGRAG